MLKYAFFCLLLAAVARTSYGQDGDADMLRKLNQDWLHSIINKDTFTLGKILADDFVMITPFGTRIGRQENLETAAMKTVDVTSINIDSMDVQLLSADVGLVTAWTSFVFREGTKETKGKNCYQDVYVKRRGRWVAVAAHVTVLSPN